MGKTSEMSEARSTEQGTSRIQRRREKLIEAIVLAAVRRRGADDVLSLVRAVADPAHPADDPVHHPAMPAAVSQEPFDAP